MISFSTAYQRQEGLVERTVAAMATLPVRAHLATGPYLMDPSRPVPPNLSVRQSFNFPDVLPEIDLMITHAGHGTTMAALGHGIPLVCLPGEQDQFDVARRVEELGAGIALSRESSVAELREAVTVLLRDPAYRSGALKTRGLFSQEDRPDLGAEELEKLAMRAD